MRRSVLHWVCVFALVVPSIGCSEETTGTGGTGGSGDTGGAGGLGDGGTGAMPCQRSADCEDNSVCTVDRCQLSSEASADLICTYEPVGCDDRNDCTEEPSCSPTAGCAGQEPLADGTVCAGGTCEDGRCALHGTALPCTEQAIRNAIAAGGGPYTFDCDGPTTVVTEAEIAINNDVILDGRGNLTVNGNDDHGVFSVILGATVELRGLTVTGGFGDGGGIHNRFSGNTLTVTNSTVSGNTGYEGAGIFNNGGTVTLTNSTVSGNVGVFGGGVHNDGGTLTIMNSTVSGNSAFAGGGIFNDGTLTLTNSTVSGNTLVCSPELLGYCDVGGEGPGIFNSGTLEVTNSIVSSHVLDRFNGCSGSVTSNGHNVESPGDTCRFDQPTDQVTVSAADLKLGELADNGGPTMTHALLPGSVAIDVIPADMCEVDEDQRGVTRPQGTACDVGALEVQP